MHLTIREREIIEIIRKEPLIAQDELAARLGITRSSAAVHISNLMKKGIIIGKGYVFNERVSCVVLGDCFSLTEISDDNGRTTIRTWLDGFGFSMSRSLARFGLDVKLMSLIGTDTDGDDMLLALEKTGVEIKNVQRLIGMESPKSVVVKNEEGIQRYRQDFDQEAYTNMMEAKEWLAINCEWLIIQPEFIKSMLSASSNNQGAQRSFIYTALEESQMGFLPENMRQIKLAVIGSPMEAHQDNLFEDHNLLDRGLENLVVTDGRNIIKVISSRNDYEIPVPPGQEFNLNKGLNDFASGIIYGTASGYPLRQAIRIGMGFVNRAEGRE